MSSRFVDFPSISDYIKSENYCQKNHGEAMFKGGMPNMQSMMKQIQKMQEKVAQVQAELE